MLAVSALAGGLFGPLSALVASALQLQLVGAHIDRIDEVLETPREQEPGAPAHALERRDLGPRSSRSDMPRAGRARSRT